jgi:hypothetical protein
MIHFCNSRVDQGDDDVLVACGLRLSTWDKPIKYSFKTWEIDCPECRPATNAKIKEEYESLEKGFWKKHELLCEAKELFKEVLTDAHDNWTLELEREVENFIDNKLKFYYSYNLLFV